jgi:ribosomal protein S18 acetylase RimI-like enzyme
VLIIANLKFDYRNMKFANAAIIRKSTMEDLDKIFTLYDLATSYQKTVFNKSWQGFERSKVQREIEAGCHFVLEQNGMMVSTFLITLSDPLIWQEANADSAIYLHRIATDPAFRGNGYVRQIVDWAKAYAAQHGQQYIRLDTHSGNEKINAYYISCGFTYQGIRQIEWTSDLPEHYKNESLSLFEMKLLG